MIWFWTWGGISFGYRNGDGLFTYDGVEVGRFAGREVYGNDGQYLGEIASGEHENRLITNLYKKSLARNAFVPTFGRSYTRSANCASYPMYVGHEDFPSPQIATNLISKRPAPTPTGMEFPCRVVGSRPNGNVLTASAESFRKPH